MHRYGCNVPHRIHIPDFTEQFFLCIYVIGMFCKEGEKIKLLTGKSFLHAVHSNSSGCLIDPDSPDFDQIIVFLSRTNKSVISCHMRLYPGNQLAGTEGFCHIVICTESKSSYLVDIVLFRRYHNDRDIFFLPDMLADFKSVHSRKHQVKHNQIKILCQR